MLHRFEFESKEFLYDVESGGLHLCKSFLSDEELEKLETPERIFVFEKDTRVKALCLNVTHNCNLKCQYCFAGYLGGGDMSEEVGKKAVDFLIESSKAIKNIEIDFFGGEPLLNFEVVKAVVKYGKERASEKGKNIIFTLTTNAVELECTVHSAQCKVADFLNENMENVVISLDGRKEVHDGVRGESYDKAIENALKFVKMREEKKYYIRGTFTNKNLDFSEDVLHLVNLGFKQISFEPVVLPKSHPLAIREEHLSKILNEYEKLAKIYVDKRAKGEWFSFFHFFVDLENSPCVNKMLTGCGAGCSYAAVDPKGNIYPCHQFIGRVEFLMGTMRRMRNEANEANCGFMIRNFFKQETVLGKEGCRECFAKYHCGGGCLAYPIDKIYCEMMRKRFELSLGISAIEKLSQNV
jgi:uncharacterized protein